MPDVVRPARSRTRWSASRRFDGDGARQSWPGRYAPPHGGRAQGDRYGTQSEQAVYREFNDRFDVIDSTLQSFDCVAIRIDREAPLGGLVERIKGKIRRARFVVADLTDERPSCYFEVGYAEALGRPVVFVASKESILEPGHETKIHFDIHQNVQFFSNHEEVAEKLSEVVERNRDAFLEEERLLTTTGVFLDWANSFTSSKTALVDPVDFSRMNVVQLGHTTTGGGTG